MPRVPKERYRPYDRTEPENLGNVLSELFALRGYGRVQSDQQLNDIWQAIVGSEFEGQTKAIELKNAVLHVGVTNSALLSELAAFYKQEFLNRIQQEYTQLKVRDIKFKLKRS